MGRRPIKYRVEVLSGGFCLGYVFHASDQGGPRVGLRAVKEDGTVLKVWRCPRLR